MKIKFYNNYTEYGNDETKEQYDLAIMKKDGYIDCDVFVEAKTVYLAFKKVATQLAKHGYKGLQNDMSFKDDFLSGLNDSDFMELIAYPDEQKNGNYGYNIEEYDGWYYIRYFEPTN